MASSLTGLVSDYLYTRRIREDSVNVEKLATTLAPLLQSAKSDELSERLTESAGEMGGRLIVLDGDGKVQADSFSKLYGYRLQLPEVLSILVNGESTAWGLHTIKNQSTAALPETSGETVVAYCAAELIGTSGRLGVLVYVSPVEEMVTSLTRIERQMVMLFGIVAVAALLIALVYASVLTRPITALTRTIQKMARGDLSARVKVRGSGEIRELAVNYNNMAEQLEALDKSRNQFVSNASHELKTPLSTMKILLETLIYQPEMPEELRTEFMQDINHEIDRLSRIVSDLLTLTRTDTGKTELKPAPCDVAELSRKVVHQLQPMAQKKKQELTVEGVESLVTSVDEARIEQVFYNLTDNAVKYTPEGGHIRVRVRREGKLAVWQVQDDGIGIPAEDKVHIFERFYRVDKARSRETGGTGLGLSIVRQLVSLHGGEVNVESELGHGSTFTVTLPIREENDHA